MADITAKQVNDLRAKTGLGMMECKKALVETGGDVDKAVEYFRKKGVKTSITARDANEGRVGTLVAPDGKRGVIVEVVCNTDFTAKSEVVGGIIQVAAEKLLANPGAKLAEDSELKAALVSLAQQTGENVQFGRARELASADGRIGSYVYAVGGKGKIAVLLDIKGDTSDDLILKLGMHIAAAKPIALNRAGVPADLIAKEREIAVEQAKNTGKPQNIAEKIAEGKLNSFFAERVLLDQEFINAEFFKGSVANLLKSKGATLQNYVRIEVGQV